jgi:hypothetical protein
MPSARSSPVGVHRRPPHRTAVVGVQDQRSVGTALTQHGRLDDEAAVCRIPGLEDLVADHLAAVDVDDQVQEHAAHMRRYVTSSLQT